MSDKKRGQKAIEVSPVELAEMIGSLEKNQPEGKFPNRSKLWAAIEASEWAKSRNPRPLTGQVAMMIAKKNDINIVTPVGKRGREKGCGPVVVGERKKRKVDPVVLAALKKSLPVQYHKDAEKAVAGNRKCATKIHCLQCSNMQKKEIALCPITHCGSYSVRPYKRVSLNMIEDSSDETNDSNATV